MGKDSAIAWTNHTFNPWWGCSKVSDECKHCYAETLAKRFGFGWGPKAEPRIFGDHHWNDPIRWNREAERAGQRARVFCGSMCDVAEDRPEFVPLRARLFEMVDATFALDWLFLSKRPENFSRLHFPIRANVWLGATVGSRRSIGRIDALRETHAPVRFLSCEPLLEDLGKLDLRGIGWVITGCESGPHARPMEAEWAESILKQCQAADIPWFFKQAVYRGQLDHCPPMWGTTWRQFPKVQMTIGAKP